MVSLFFDSFFLGEHPLVVVRVPLRKVWGVIVHPSSWVFCSDPEEVQGAVDCVVLQIRRPGLEAGLWQ